jgi:hypothetical protein
MLQDSQLKLLSAIAEVKGTNPSSLPDWIWEDVFNPKEFKKLWKVLK